MALNIVVQYTVQYLKYIYSLDHAEVRTISKELGKIRKIYANHLPFPRFSTQSDQKCLVDAFKKASSPVSIVGFVFPNSLF